MLVKQQLSGTAMAGALAMAALWWTIGGSRRHELRGQRDTGFQGGPVTQTERGNHRSTVDAPADGIGSGDLGLGPPPPVGMQSLCAPILGGNDRHLLLFNRIPKCGSSFVSHIIKVGARCESSRMR